MGQNLLRCCCIVVSATLCLGCKGGLHESEFGSLDQLLAEPTNAEAEDITGQSVLRDGDSLNSIDVPSGPEAPSPLVLSDDDSHEKLEAMKIDFCKEVRKQLEPSHESLDTVVDDIVLLAKSRENSATLALELLVARRANHDAAQSDGTTIQDELDDHTVSVLIQSIRAHQTKLDVHVDNLANVDTFGFKRSRCLLEEHVLSSDDTSLPIDEVIGDGVKVSALNLDLAQGSLQPTGNSLDVAVEGRGFIQVQNAEGDVFYSRTGHFSMNANSAIVLGAANSPLQLKPSIHIPPEAIRVNILNNGDVFYQTPRLARQKLAGSIRLARFTHPERLKRVNGNLFVETDESGPPHLGHPGDSGLGDIVQNCLESSNVELLDETVQILTTLKTLRLLRQLLKLPT